MPRPITRVDFARAARQLEHLGHGLYRDSRTAHFYERPYVRGRQTTRRLLATSERAARLELARKRSEQARARVGLASDPYTGAGRLTVADLCDGFEKDGCPARSNRSRTPKNLAETKRALVHLRAFFGRSRALELSLDDCRDYHDWRLQRLTRGAGHRTVDIELGVLSGVFRWAMRHSRKTGIRANPIAIERERFTDPRAVVHCREHQPADADELHALAARLFEVRQSEVLGWLLLFQSMTGQRIHEVVEWRWFEVGRASTRADQPAAGYLTALASAWPRLDLPRAHLAMDAAMPKLYLTSSDTSKGTFSYAPLHHALTECLAAYAAWRALRRFDSAWFFPSPRNKTRPVAPSALTHALRRLTLQRNLVGRASTRAAHRTSHGLRSYYVNVLRSHGVPDAEIALLIGQRSGGALIPSTYGTIPPHKLTWLPADPRRAAWKIFEDSSPGWSRKTPDIPLGILSGTLVPHQTKRIGDKKPSSTRNI